MKFTDRSFAGPGEYLDAESIGDEIRFVLLWSTGPDEEETVGEAHHHSELEDLANHVVEGGARSADFLAWLKREPDNPHDPEAVAIVALLEDQMPETVSYLPRPVARHYGPLLAEIDEKTGREVVCRGRIIVPKEDRHHYSVVLRLSPALLAEFLVWVALPEEKKSDATKEAWKRRRRPEFWTSSTDAIRPTPAPLSGQEVSMGTIDPTLRPVRVQPAPVQEPARKPPVMPQKPSMTAAGAIGVTFGLILFTLGSFSGWNLILMVLGLVFIAAGYASRQKPPAKLCPSCRMEIPMEATVCGHCRSALPS